MLKLRILLTYAVGLGSLFRCAQAQDWTTATHLDGLVNSGFSQRAEVEEPFASRDGLSLYFACNNCQPGGFGGRDLWVSHRANTHDPWGQPENLGPVINTAANEGNPNISSDGQRLYFVSNRTTAGSRGGNDIWVSRWNGSAWGPPENLGDGVNTAAVEQGPAEFYDPATQTTTLFFSSDRFEPGNGDIFASVLQSDGTFGPAAKVVELSSPSLDQSPMIRQDGLEIFFASSRSGSIKSLMGVESIDVWTSSRASTSDPWSTPTNVDPSGTHFINTRRHEAGPAVSFDGMTLYFAAAVRLQNVSAGCAALTATCVFDIWSVTRPDTTPPNAPSTAINPAPNAAGWNHTDTLVSFTSNGDPGGIFSGVASCGPNVTLASDGDEQVVSGSCTDNAGNTSATSSATVRLDKTPPHVEVTGVHDGANYILGAVPAANCETFDSLSGVASPASLSLSGGSGNGVGTFSAVCSGASDIAGNVAPPARVSYSVSYAFSGFLSPLGSGLGDYKLGSTIPLKWRLMDGNGQLISDLGAIKAFKIAFNGDCAGPAEGEAFDPGTNGATGIRFDPASMQFVANWQTRGLTAGCYTVTLGLDDKTEHAAIVRLR
jgi:hypothetical protein